MPDKTVDPLHAAIGRRLHSANEIMGSVARFSCIRKNSRHTIKKPPAINAFVTSSLPAYVSDIISAAMDTMNSAAPAKSMDGRACRSDSFRNAIKPAADARPIGTFIQSEEHTSELQSH